MMSLSNLTITGCVEEVNNSMNNNIDSNLNNSSDNNLNNSLDSNISSNIDDKLPVPESDLPIAIGKHTLYLY